MLRSWLLRTLVSLKAGPLTCPQPLCDPYQPFWAWSRGFFVPCESLFLTNAGPPSLSRLRYPTTSSLSRYAWPQLIFHPHNSPHESLPKEKTLALPPCLPPSPPLHHTGALNWVLFTNLQLPLSPDPLQSPRKLRVHGGPRFPPSSLSKPCLPVKLLSPLPL